MCARHRSSITGQDLVLIFNRGGLSREAREVPYEIQKHTCFWLLAQMLVRGVRATVRASAVTARYGCSMRSPSRTLGIAMGPPWPTPVSAEEAAKFVAPFDNIIVGR